MSEVAPTTQEAPPPEPSPRRIPLWACPLIGIGAALAGLLPWLVRGPRLPVQDLWAVDTAPGDMPLVLLPFSQYSLTLLFGLIVVGSAAAGIVARATAERLPRGGFALMAVGLLAAQAAAITQSALVVRDGLQERSISTLYLGALVAVCTVSFLVGLVSVLLIARAPRAGALLGLTLGAIAAAPWAGGLLQPLLTTDQGTLSSIVWLLQWVTPVLTGIAIAWTGVNTVGRVLAALVSLALIWIAPAAMTGIASAAGSRALARDPLDMIDYGVSVFRMALFIPELALRPIVAALAVAVIGLLVRWAVARARRDRRSSAAY
jgi:hypothetical protein